MIEDYLGLQRQVDAIAHTADVISNAATNADCVHLNVSFWDLLSVSTRLSIATGAVSDAIAFRVVFFGMRSDISAITGSSAAHPARARPCAGLSDAGCGACGRCRHAGVRETYTKGGVGKCSEIAFAEIVNSRARSGSSSPLVIGRQRLLVPKPLSLARTNRRMQRQPTSNYARGAIYGLAAVCIWAAFIVVSRLRVRTSLTPWDVAAIRFAVAGILLSPLVELLGATAGAAFVALTPATTALLGIPVIGEWPSAIDWIAIIVISIGVNLVSGGPRPVQWTGPCRSHSARSCLGPAGPFKRGVTTDSAIGQAVSIDMATWQTHGQPLPNYRLRH